MGAEPVRTWTDLKGRTMEASFIKYSGDKIVIKRKDGLEFRVLPALFSAVDREYLANLNKTEETASQKDNESSKDEYFKGAVIVLSINGEATLYEPSKAKAKTSSGSASSDGNESEETKISEGDLLMVGSQIRVQANSEAVLLFSNGTVASVGAETHLEISNFLQKGFDESDKNVSDLDEEISASTLLLDLEVGELVVDVRKLKKKSNFEISTPLGVAGIRGTSFSLSVSADSTNLSVLTGLVEFVEEDKNEKQVGSEKVLLLSKEKESEQINLTDDQKDSIAQVIARAKAKSEGISLSSLRDKLSRNLKIHLVPSAGNMEMIWVKSGTFMMGSPPSEKGRREEETLRKVTLSNGFYLGRYEVTQKQWKLVMETSTVPCRFVGDDRPMESVSWVHANSFCYKLSRLEERAGRLLPGWSYALPTEAEWEYSCRAGTKSAYSWGNDVEPFRANYYWTGGNARMRDARQTVEVGQYEPNGWGFFNMHGNVSEWVADWYADYPKGLSATDPTGPFISPRALSLPDLRGKRMRVTRGGAWNRSAGRSAARDSLQYQRSSPHVGFRVALKESR